MHQLSQDLKKPWNRHSFNYSDLKRELQIEGRENRDARSKSLLYKNRSLKQLFGDIPAFNEYNIALNNALQRKSKKKQSKEQKCTPLTKVKSSEKAIDEYLIKPNKKTKLVSRQRDNQTNLGNKDEIHKRRQIKGNEMTKLAASTQIMKTQPNFYDPNAYRWRKTPSKQKDNILREENKSILTSFNQKVAPKEPQSAKSQYYETPNSSQIDSVRKGTKVNRINKQNARSSSIEAFNSKEKKQLRPKVVKHIFDQVSSRQKHHSLSLKKSLLFTFGI